SLCIEPSLAPTGSEVAMQSGPQPASLTLDTCRGGHIGPHSVTVSTARLVH
ncbi:hypothetical protein KUCAC02_005549, partial [Chaenocephalus aceratus]